MGRGGRVDDAADVVVVGGGPAGAAAALTLLRHTPLRVLVLERSACAEARVGEAVSSGLAPLLRYLDVEEAFAAGVGRVASHGVRAVWGSERESGREALLSPMGHGWHVDRLALDRMLLSEVAARGGRVWLRSRLGTCRRVADGWEVEVSGRRLRATVLVEASGRACALGRRLGARPVAADRLVGVVGRWAPSAGPAAREGLSVEACEWGWWYTAPLPEGGMVAALMTDADLARELGADRPEGWPALLAEAPLTRSRLSVGQLAGPLAVRSARPQTLHPVAGPGWIACGDAALAHDPLSSLGIGHAIASGIQAARVLWADWPAGMAAAEVYASDVRTAYDRHVSARRATYTTERRWPASPFWRRRLDPTPAGVA